MGARSFLGGGEKNDIVKVALRERICNSSFFNGTIESTFKRQRNSKAGAQQLEYS